MSIQRAPPGLYNYKIALREAGKAGAVLASPLELVTEGFNGKVLTRGAVLYTNWQYHSDAIINDRRDGFFDSAVERVPVNSNGFWVAGQDQAGEILASFLTPLETVYSNKVVPPQVTNQRSIPLIESEMLLRLALYKGHKDDPYMRLLSKLCGNYNPLELLDLLSTQGYSHVSIHFLDDGVLKAHRVRRGENVEIRGIILERDQHVLRINARARQMDTGQVYFVK